MSGPPNPFNTTLRRDPAQGADLRARIDAEIAERIAEAVDFVCLEIMVTARRTRQLPAPLADSPRDRAEFDAGVRAFLERLATEITAADDADLRARAGQAATRAGSDRVAQLIAAQVVLAKALPDYWQRFETVRAAHAVSVGAEAPAEASGGERRSVLRRLFGGGS